MAKFNKVAALSAAAVVMPFLMTTPAVAAGDQNGRRALSEDQRVGYLGRTTRSAIAANILSRIKNQKQVRRVSDTADRLVMWNEVLLDAIALDHTPDPITGALDFIQGGPVRTSRALAMTQVAVFDAVNAFSGKFKPYNDIGSAPRNASVDAAIAYAAHDVLVNLYPAQKARLDLLLSSDISQIGDGSVKIAAGKAVGQASAVAMIARRTGDGSDDSEADFGGGGRVATGNTNWYGEQVNGGETTPFHWEPDPLTPGATPGSVAQLTIGAYWGGVRPWVLARGDQFRAPPPPEPGSAEYRAGFDEVKSIGANPNSVPSSTSTARTRFIGNFWGYDAAPLLGTPPRLYNQIAVKIALEQGLTKVNELARYLAMVNAGLADAGIAAWDTKWFYNYWRPVTGVRRGAEDGDAATAGDPTWQPVGVSVINTTDPVVATPPFPAYVSGHATFAASMFETLRSFFPNNTRFTIVSDEYNGTGTDPFGTPRPLVPVRFQSLQQAQEENGQSRVYNGVHWQWDNIRGQNIGVAVSQYLQSHAFQRVRGRDGD